MRTNPTPAAHDPHVTVETINGHPARRWLDTITSGRRPPWPVRHAHGTVDRAAVTWDRDPHQRACAAHQPGCDCPQRLAAAARAARAAAINAGRYQRTPPPVFRGRVQRHPPGRPAWPLWATRVAAAAVLSAAIVAAAVERLTHP